MPGLSWSPPVTGGASRLVDLSILVCGKKPESPQGREKSPSPSFIPGLWVCMNPPDSLGTGGGFWSLLSKLMAAGDGYGCDTEHKGCLPTVWEKVGVSSELMDLPEWVFPGLC